MVFCISQTPGGVFAAAHGQEETVDRCASSAPPLACDTTIAAVAIRDLA